MRKLALILAATAAMLAMTASTAAAQNIRIVSEATGVNCPAVEPSDSTIEFPIASTVHGGCISHITNVEGRDIVTAHIFGIESVDSRCNIELTQRVGSNGEGYFTNINLSGPDCTRQTCGKAVGAPEAWEHHMEEFTSSSARIEVHLCVENLDGTGRQTCHLFVPFREDSVGTHRYEYGTANASDQPQEIACEGFTGFRAELTLHWKTELTTLEIIHLL